MVAYDRRILPISERSLITTTSRLRPPEAPANSLTAIDLLSTPNVSS